MAFSISHNAKHRDDNGKPHKLQDAAWFVTILLLIHDEGLMQKRNMAVPAVYLILEREGKILLARRFQTGYQDGNYNLPSGHVEDGELPIAAIIRESREEIGIDLREEDLKFVHASYRPPHDETGNRVDFFFHATKWSGEVVNAEPHKCDDLKWTSPQELPKNLTPHVQHVIGCVLRGEFFSELGIDFLKANGVYTLSD